jgi:hypothetical protein
MTWAAKGENVLISRAMRKQHSLACISRNCYTVIRYTVLEILTTLSPARPARVSHIPDYH